MDATFKSRSCLRRIFLPLIFSLTPFSGCQIQAQAMPSGWVLDPNPKADFGCANFSEGQRVSLSDDGQIEIQEIPSSYERAQYSILHLPKGVKRQSGMIGRESLLKTQDGGWLLGFDAGEFGGGLWSADPNGITHKLWPENVRGFVDTPQGVLVFVGLAHLGLNSGKVLIVPPGASADVEELVKLDGAPQTITRASSDTALVVTDRGLTEISSSGSARTQLRDEFGGLYPNSVLVMPDGTVYIGMRLFVVRFDPHAEHDADQWFRPQRCKRFASSRCACKAK